MRKPPKYLSLKRPKLRQSWNIHNLYNLSRATGEEMCFSRDRTFFQQKWSAKARTRGYHGEHVPEKKWKRMFSRRLKKAVDMPPSYLAAHDGSEQASGRGSGLTTSQPSASDYWAKPKEAQSNPIYKRVVKMRQGTSVLEMLEAPLSGVTPLMQMTFAPLERRLDTAIFRSLFASSIRQARQFVVHGAVKVNGKKMVYPSYQLNPGDMFQVDVAKVLQATGPPQTPHDKSSVLGMLKNNEDKYQKMEQSLLSLKAKEAKKAQASATPAEGEADAEVEAKAEASTDTVAETEAAAGAPAEEGAVAEDAAPAEEKKALSPEDALELRRLRLECALLPIKLVLREKDVRGNREHREKMAMRIRNFKDRIGYVLSPGSGRNLDINELIDGLKLEMKTLNMLRDDEETREKEQRETPKDHAQHLDQRKALLHKALEVFNVKNKKDVINAVGFDNLSAKDLSSVRKILTQDQENPVDETKPYKTPWMPRPFMSPWAFVPRYLEVNPNICAAVYLRHPVARRGYAEVPTPFSFFTNQLAHTWYAERGGA